MRRKLKIFAAAVLIAVLACVIALAVRNYRITNMSADLSSIRLYADENKDEITETALAADDLLSGDYAVILHTDGKYILMNSERDMQLEVLSEDSEYMPLREYLEEHEELFSIEKMDEGIMFDYDDNDSVLFSRLSLDEMTSPFDKECGWEKRIEDNRIIFISDHRKDRESFDKGMFYRIDMEAIGGKLFAIHMTIKYPWYAPLVS